MTIFTKSKSQAAALFAENGVAAFGVIFSKGTLEDLHNRPDGDGVHQNIINIMANALPKNVNFIGNTKVVAKSPEPEDDSYVLKVLVPTREGLVNDEPIAAGTAVYCAGNSGAVVSCPEGKVLEFVFTASTPWVAKEVAPIGEDADQPGNIPKVVGTKPKAPKGKAKATGDVETITVSTNTDDGLGDVSTPAKVETSSGTDVVAEDTATEEAQVEAGSVAPSE